MKWTSLVQRIKSRGPTKSDELPEAMTKAIEPHLQQRYEPCSILTRNDVANIVWFEDVLAHYGSDTTVFELYVLVSDVAKASRLLTEAGYMESGPESLEPSDTRAGRGGLRMEKNPSAAGDNAVLLVSADVWGYDLQQRVDDSFPPLPPLNTFIDSLMSYWLRLTENEYIENLLWSMSLASLIYYAYNLKSTEGQVVKTVEFASQLQPEHRELHYDLVGQYPRQAGISSYRKHEYHAMRRRQVLDGQFTPRPYPSGNIPVSLAEFPHLTGLDFEQDGRGKKSKSKVSVCAGLVTR